MRLTSLLFTAFFALTACSSSPEHKLDVQIVTGLVGGAEFNRVKTEVFRTRGESNYAVTEAEAVAYFGPAYARGVRVASFPALPSGDYTVRVTLMRPSGTKLIEQPLRFMLSDNFVARVYLDRGCVGVECPNPGGGSAALAACLQGTCVDPRCNPADATTHEYCTVDLCENDSQCSNTAACATSYCASGVCITEQIATGEGACAEGEWCSPNATENACQDVPDSTLEGDAGVDGGNLLCGRICQGTPTACVTGFYWDCESGEPVCTPFIFAPNGTSCGEGGEACDGRGTCEAAPPATFTVSEGDERVDESPALQRVTPAYKVYLAEGVTETITGTVTSADPAVCSVSASAFSVSPASPTSSEFVVTIVDDDIFSARTCTIVFAADGATVERTFTIRDDDAVRLTASPSGGAPAYPGTLPGDSVILSVFATRMTPDGGRVLFTSAASNLTSSTDTNDVFDSFIWDATSRTTDTAAGLVPSSGSRALGWISGGSSVVFYSTSTDLGAGSSARGRHYSRPLSGRALTLYDLGSLDSELTSDRGVYGADTSFDSNVLLADVTGEPFDGITDTNGTSDVYAYELEGTSPAPVLVSHSSTSATTTASGRSCAVHVSRDGRFVSFLSNADDVTTTLSEPGFYVHDRTSDETFGLPSGWSLDGADSCSSRFFGFAISGDARRAVFTTQSPAYIDGDITPPEGSEGELGGSDVIAWNWETGATTPVSVREDGARSNGDSFFASMSQNGRYVAFVTSATDMVDGFTPPASTFQTLIVDLQTGARRYISRRSDGGYTPAGVIVIPLGVSDDGRLITAGVWVTESSNQPDLYYFAGF